MKTKNYLYIVEPIVDDEEREAEENDEWQGSIRALKNSFASITKKSKDEIVKVLDEIKTEKEN